ncbi:MAG: MMPL family transporter [Candidatus Marinimicrobia bacterium]|nr:MMPL family transporter [Candidatus Neomarinimicrobiota bacterium]MCF7851233.1 MMPL family transporter [Candidatus Neomarinimicrobiota bacterium]MCF7905032.1 MMPL family transporter [Candidatus Neomarinimicrobiota bacterium]
MKQWFINQSVEHPKRSIILTIALTLLMGTGLMHFTVEDDFMKMLPHDIESMMTWNEVKDEFGSTDLMFLGFGHPGTDVLNAKDLATLWDVSLDLEELEMVDEIMSISTSDKMESIDGFLEVSALQAYRDLNDEELESLRTYLDTNTKIRTRSLAENGDFFNIMIRPLVGAKNDVLVSNMKEVAAKHLDDYEVHWGGQGYLTGALPAMIRDDVMQLMRAGLIGMLLILLFSLRNVSAVGSIFGTIILSMIFMFGFNGWMLYLTGSDKFMFGVLNTSMPIILLTIANSYGVHVITKFFRKMRDNKDPKTAVRASLNSLALPIFLTAITTIAAFLCMVFAPLEPLMGYGFSISMGIAWAWILSTVFLPSILVLKKWNPDSAAVSHPSHFERFVIAFGEQVLSRPKTVLITGAIVVLIGIAGIFKLNIEVNMKSFFKPENPIRESLEFMDSEMTGTMDLQLLINADLKSPEVLKKMESIQAFMEDHRSVTLSISIADVIKQMHRMINDDDPAFETIPDTRAKVNNLFTMYSMSGDPDDFSSLVDYDYEKGLATSMMRSISTSEIVELVDEIETFLQQEDYKDLNITITGLLIVFRDLVGLIIRSSFISILASVLIIAFIAAYFFKHWFWGVLAVVPLSSAVILNFGLMGIFGVDLNHVTALLSAIIIGVGVDFAIHYISQFRNHLHTHGLDGQLSRETMRDVGFPVILDAASNMAFGALLFSMFIPMQHMGGLMIFAMVSTSTATLTLLAILLELNKRRLAKIEGIAITD